MSLEKLKIIAGGGGGPSSSSRPAIEAALNLSVVEKPNVLIIPTPKRTLEAFEKTIPGTYRFFTSLGLRTELLHDFNENIDPDQASDKINSADVIYTAGGDTLHMMEVLRRHKLDTQLARRALAGEVVLSGISAGAILPTKWGHSDSLSYRPETADDWEYVRVNGLGIAPLAITPHFNTASDRLGARKDQFAAMLANQPSIPAFGIDNLAAIQIADGKLSQVQSDPNHFVHTANRETDGSITFDAMSANEELDVHTLKKVS